MVLWPADLGNTVAQNEGVLQWDRRSSRSPGCALPRVIFSPE